MAGSVQFLPIEPSALHRRCADRRLRQCPVYRTTARPRTTDPLSMQPFEP